MRDVRLGICGLGTVGSGVFNLMRRNSVAMAASANRNITIGHIGSRRDHPECDTSNVKVSRDIFQVAKDSDIDIVIELIGGTTVARDLVMTSIEHGKHVITANKALIAEHGAQIFDSAGSTVLVSASTNEKENKMTANNLISAKAIGQKIAERAIEAGIKKVVFDRSGYKYHGRIKAIAESARDAGLESRSL